MILSQFSSLIILGAGYVALELGQMFQRFGTEGNLLQRSKQLLAHGYEPEIGGAIREVFEKEGMNVITSATARSVRQAGTEIIVDLGTGGETRRLRAEKLLVATGRRPNSDRIAIEKAGWKLATEVRSVSMNSYARTCPTFSLVATLSAAKSAIR